MQNFTFSVLSAEQVAQCDLKLAELRSLIPQSEALSGQDRVRIRKLDIRAQNFARDAVTWSKDVPELSVPFVDIPKMETALEFHDQMVRLRASLESLARQVDDLALRSGSVAENMARACYQSFKLAAQHRVNGASTAYAMLKTRYKAAGKKGSADPFEKNSANPVS